MVPYEMNDFISRVPNHLNSIIRNDYCNNLRILEEPNGLTKDCPICMSLTIIIKLKPNSSAINHVFFNFDAGDALVKGIKFGSYICGNDIPYQLKT